MALHFSNRSGVYFLALAYLALACSCGSFFQPKKQADQSAQQDSMVIHTMYGDATITEPVLLDLLASSAIERLKYVRQYGVAFYACPEINSQYTRYEHSLGVMFLLRRFNAPLVEQVAGLLHDASHTVFSHVGDYFQASKNPKYALQDEIHAWYLEQSNVGRILNRYGITIDDVLITEGKNKMLKAEVPNLCGDNLEYVLKAGILTNVLTPADVKTILGDVRYGDDRWYFASVPCAKQFALISLFNTEHIWGGVNNHLAYQWTSEALKQAIAIGEISREDINFSIDTAVWEKLCTSKDEKIKVLIKRIMNCKKYYTKGTPDNHTLWVKTKFRGIDPWIKIGTAFKRLTECDAAYKCEFDRVKKQVTEGWYVNLPKHILA